MLTVIKMYRLDRLLPGGFLQIFRVELVTEIIHLFIICSVKPRNL